MPISYKKTAERNCQQTVFVPSSLYVILAYASLLRRQTVSGDVYSICPTSKQERRRMSHSTMQKVSCGGRS